MPGMTSVHVWCDGGVMVTHARWISNHQIIEKSAPITLHPGWWNWYCIIYIGTFQCTGVLESQPQTCLMQCTSMKMDKSSYPHKRDEFWAQSDDLSPHSGHYQRTRHSECVHCAGLLSQSLSYCCWFRVWDIWAMFVSFTNYFTIIWFSKHTSWKNGV